MMMHRITNFKVSYCLPDFYENSLNIKKYYQLWAIVQYYLGTKSDS